MTPFRFAFRPSATRRQAHGAEAERLAAAYLRRCGYTIEATNVRFRVGELDVVACEGDALCFIEVRSGQRQSPFGTPAESITGHKQTRLFRAAQCYLQRRRTPWEGPIRFDVVTVERDENAATPTLIRDAFRPGW